MRRPSLDGYRELTRKLSNSIRVHYSVKLFSVHTNYALLLLSVNLLGGILAASYTIDFFKSDVTTVNIIITTCVLTICILSMDIIANYVSFRRSQMGPIKGKFRYALWFLRLMIDLLNSAFGSFVGTEIVNRADANTMIFIVLFATFLSAYLNVTWLRPDKLKY